MIYVVADSQERFGVFCEKEDLNPRDRSRVRRLMSIADVQAIRPGPDDRLVDLGGPVDLLIAYRQREELHA